MSAADTELERPAWIKRKGNIQDLPKGHSSCRPRNGERDAGRENPMMNEPCISGLAQASAR